MAVGLELKRGQGKVGLEEVKAEADFLHSER